MKIAFGTDAGSFSWDEPLVREFVLMVEAGMTPMAAIQSATSKGAETLGMTGQLGVVAPGAYADVVAVRGRGRVEGSKMSKGRSASTL